MSKLRAEDGLIVAMFASAAGGGVDGRADAVIGTSGVVLADIDIAALPSEPGVCASPFLTAFEGVLGPVSSTASTGDVISPLVTTADSS